MNEQQIEGQLLAPEAALALAEAGELTLFPSALRFQVPAGAWFLRSGLLLQQLLPRLGGGVLHTFFRRDSPHLLLVVDEGCRPLREEVAMFLFTRAQRQLEARCFPEAVEAAETAWSVALKVTPQQVALWVQALRANGEERKALGILGLEKRTRGDTVGAAVEEILNDRSPLSEERGLHPS